MFAAFLQVLMSSVGHVKFQRQTLFTQKIFYETVYFKKGQMTTILKVGQITYLWFFWLLGVGYSPISQ